MTARSAVNGDRPGARTGHSTGANRTRSLMENYDWPQEDQVASRSGWSLFACEELDYMAAWVDAEVARIAISHETWATLSYDEAAIMELFLDMTGGASGMKFIVVDAGPYAQAVRKEAADSMASEEPDPIAAVAEQINRLVVQASGLNRQPSALQQRIFAERYVKLRAELSALEERTGRARAALDLAGTLLVDITR